VTSFTNSVLACRAFVSHPDRFDLVITDMTMPVMTGVALSREILKIRPEMPVIICTGHSDFITEKKAKAAGIREFMMKPILMKDLARVVREVLDGSAHGS
jgi:DNA-binding NtrC family response regulator